MVSVLGLSFELVDVYLAVGTLMVYWLASALLYWATGVQPTILLGVALSALVLAFLVKTKANKPRGTLELLFYRLGLWGAFGGLPPYGRAKRYGVFPRRGGKDAVMKVIDLAKRRG